MCHAANQKMWLQHPQLVLAGMACSVNCFPILTSVLRQQTAAAADAQQVNRALIVGATQGLGLVMACAAAAMCQSTCLASIAYTYHPLLLLVCEVAGAPSGKCT